MTDVDVETVLGSASRRFVEVVASVGDDAWDRPTVCDVSVRELVEHVLSGNEFAVRLLAGASADEARQGIDQVRRGADVVQQAAVSCAAQTAAFAAAHPGRVLHHPSGDLHLPTFVRLRLAELVLHGWDVAAAVGTDATMDPRAARALLAMAEAAEQLGPGGAYGEGRAAAPDATVQDRLLAAYGRSA